MKTAIKLILIYLGFQLLGAIIVMIPTVIYSMIQYGHVNDLNDITLAPTMLVSFILMTLYLWKKDYISSDERTWSPVSASYLVLAVIICLAAIVIIGYILLLMPWLPNFMKSSFDILQSGWLGILAITTLGPVVEELIFRGAITRVLLKKYDPAKAIILSALAFGVFHMNPVQIVSATLVGLLLAWMYYKTASLIPCILIHMVNNSLSVYLNINYPEVETTAEMFTGTEYIGLVVALAVFAVTFFLMNRTTVSYPWKEDMNEQIEK